MIMILIVALIMIMIMLIMMMALMVIILLMMALVILVIMLVIILILIMLVILMTMILMILMMIILILISMCTKVQSEFPLSYARNCGRSDICNLASFLRLACTITFNIKILLIAWKRAYSVKSKCYLYGYFTKTPNIT